MFHIKNGLKQEEVLSSLLLTMF